MNIRRLSAYIIDLIFIILLTSLIVQIRFLNPNFEEYYEASEKYSEFYNNAIKENDLNFMNSYEYKEINYDLQKNGISNTIIEIIIYIAYFTGFQLWNKGQTLGKKIMKIKIVSNPDNEKLKWYQLLLRSIIIYNLVFTVISLILICIVNKKTYIEINNILELIASSIFYLNAFFIILRNDNRGLHDIIGKTKVEME